jgi:hypothetical protein
MVQTGMRPPEIGDENRLRELVFRVCCDHELAAGGFAGGGGGGGWIILAGISSPPQTRFGAEHALRLRDDRWDGDERLDCVSRAQGRPARRDGQNEIRRTNLLMLVL